MFKKNLVNLQNAISLAIKHRVDLSKKPDDEKALYNYDEKQKKYYLNNLKSSLKLLKSDSLELTKLVKHDVGNEPAVGQIFELIPELESANLGELSKTAKKMANLAKQLNFPKEEQENTFSAHVPAEIQPDINADINELNKCFNNGCYRSSVILCGRLLETALHRKYYELTGNDLLEKSPGIGLGNIIAKLKDNDIALDPGLTNQIHLINQVRIFSVHKKKDAFYPSQQQTHATILYTLDVLEKLFK